MCCGATHIAVADCWPKLGSGQAKSGLPVGAAAPKTAWQKRRLRVTMSNVFYYLSMLAAPVVAVVLVFGLLNMLKGDSPNTSQKLMRWRVILQFVALVILMLAVFFRR